MGLSFQRDDTLPFCETCAICKSEVLDIPRSSDIVTCLLLLLLFYKCSPGLGEEEGLLEEDEQDPVVDVAVETTSCGKWTRRRSVL